MIDNVINMRGFLLAFRQDRHDLLQLLRKPFH